MRQKGIIGLDDYEKEIQFQLRTVVCSQPPATAVILVTCVCDAGNPAWSFEAATENRQP